MGWPIHTADSGDTPFSTARSLNKAADADWDIAVIHDADCWVNLDSIRTAVEQAADLTYAWDRLVTLTREASTRFHEGQREFTPGDAERVRPPGRLPPGGPRVVTRELWDRVGGFDPRFKGWGFEDNAFRHVCKQATGGYRRVEGMLYQLWHPRNPNDPYFSRKAANRRIYQSIKR